MRRDIREQLSTMGEEKYREFSASLTPGVTNMLGIRLPELRKMAKQIAKTDWQQAIAEDDIYYEETLLRGMVISYVKGDMETMLPYITDFIPLVNSWSICDSVFMGMDILEKDRERTWEYIQPYLQSAKEFEIRVALIIMMQHLLKCDADGKKMSRLRQVTIENLSDDKEKKGPYLERILTAADSVVTDAYYVSMGVAWLIAEAFCCFPYHTYLFLKENSLDNTTHNKAIQKITESRIPTDEVKDILRALKRK